jgi:exodeoxyribonuclease VII large subunit
VALETSPDLPAPVRHIAGAIAGWVHRLGAVWVEGQLAQISRRPGVGTVFMTMRDAVADISIQVTCSRVIFDSMSPPLVEGASVVIHAKPSYYANRGTLSLAAREIRVVGLGELLAQLERRRQLLAAEGLFAADLKRPLPFLPRRVGLVTAPNSAAERDVVDNTRRRWPAVDFAVSHAAMQGPRATPEIMEALNRLEADVEVDVIVIARGGGSIEDLLPFSDEALIRVVHRLRTPVVSAIGHEPDMPLLDLVADVRASTPTDAAKLIVPDIAEESRGVAWAEDRLHTLIRQRLDREQETIAALRSRPVLSDPHVLVRTRADELDRLRDRARFNLRHSLDRATDELGHHRARARALSPLATLRRGYSVVQDTAGHIVSTVDQVRDGAALTLRVADGRIHATAGDVEQLHLPGAGNGPEKDT